MAEAGTGFLEQLKSCIVWSWTYLWTLWFFVMLFLVYILRVPLKINDNLTTGTGTGTGTGGSSRGSPGPAALPRGGRSGARAAPGRAWSPQHRPGAHRPFRPRLGGCCPELAVPAGVAGPGAPQDLPLLLITWAQVKERGASRGRARPQLAVMRSVARRRACAVTSVKERRRALPGCSLACQLLPLSALPASRGASRLCLSPPSYFCWSSRGNKSQGCRLPPRFHALFPYSCQQPSASGARAARFTPKPQPQPSEAICPPVCLLSLHFHSRLISGPMAGKKTPLKLRGSECSPGAFLAAGGVGTAEGFIRKILFVDNSWFL